MFKKLDERFGENSLWQLIKFNIVGFSITFIQLLLANILPYFFDSFTLQLPSFLRNIFDPDSLFHGENSKYVVDGVVTWGYVLPFFLSNLIGNIYGYFVNMKTTFKGKGKKYSLLIYMIVIIILILFTTWFQGYIYGLLSKTSLAFLSRTIATMLAGTIQLIILFPLEKFILFN